MKKQEKTDLKIQDTNPYYHVYGLTSVEIFLRCFAVSLIAIAFFIFTCFLLHYVYTANILLGIDAIFTFLVFVSISLFLFYLIYLTYKDTSTRIKIDDDNISFYQNNKLKKSYSIRNFTLLKSKILHEPTFGVRISQEYIFSFTHEDGTVLSVSCPHIKKTDIIKIQADIDNRKKNVCSHEPPLSFYEPSSTEKIFFINKAHLADLMKQRTITENLIIVIFSLLVFLLTIILLVKKELNLYFYVGVFLFYALLAFILYVMAKKERERDRRCLTAKITISLYDIHVDDFRFYPKDISKIVMTHSENTLRTKIGTENRIILIYCNNKMHRFIVGHIQDNKYKDPYYYNEYLFLFSEIKKFCMDNGIPFETEIEIDENTFQ